MSLFARDAGRKGMTMYQITITKTETVDKMMGRKWEKGGTEKPGSDGYGYTPMISRPTEVETELLRQSVETLDLIAVIKAVNGI